MINLKNSMSLLLAVCLALPAFAQEGHPKVKAEYMEVNAFAEDNEECLSCHGETKYTLTSEEWGKTIVRAMDKVIDRDAYYSGVHASFMCSDCHMGDFSEYPHTMDARMEDNLTCMDCHGYDETYAKYHFEVIDEEVMGSVHNLEGFSCWSCHDPHSYRPNMRGTQDIRTSVAFSNAMCLDCHMNYDNFNLMTDREEINLVESHDWLPNQVAHASSVRCIECHTEINDTILIAHKILPREEAVRNCAECHSRDSRLMHTLYKFQVQEGRNKAGFANGIILNDAYVIGANQNIFLNWLSFIFLGLVLLVIGFHVFMRITKL